MQYKILLIKNNVSKKFEKKYLPKGFDIEVDEIQTNFPVTFRSVGNWRVKGNVIDFPFYAKIMPLVPRYKYNAVIIEYNEVPNTNNSPKPSVRVSICEEMPLYPETDLIQVCTRKNIAHELGHAFAKKMNRVGIKIADTLDTYKFDELEKLQEFAKTQWEKICSLNPIVNPLSSKPIVTIERFSDNGTETLGDLTFGNFHCKTLERSWKNNIRNISSIPKGTYNCKYTFSPRFLKYTYEIQSVPNRSGIRIHSGNYFFDIDGCILLGSGFSDLNYDKQTDVVNSRTTITQFEKLLNKRPFTLIIE